MLATASRRPMIAVNHVPVLPSDVTLHMCQRVSVCLCVLGMAPPQFGCHFGHALDS